jgi:hypothetical protein
MALPFTIKSILKAKKRIMEIQNTSPRKNIIFEKYPLKENQINPSRYHNSITNLKFQQKPKSHLSKILIQ